MRAPNKFCIDLLFMVIFCFLLATFVYVAKMYFKIRSQNQERLAAEIGKESAKEILRKLKII